MSHLTKKQKDLFDALHNSRAEDYKVFSKKDYGGLFRSVIDKYPESAHFVYELLQNADDANATEVSITLRDDSLLFKHNGTKRFNVTPVDDDETGDINSITGIGNSTKKDKHNSIDDTQNKIGKFGVGFKAVFQYTDTPEIYDDVFKFKIENYIIPTLLDNDSPERRDGETLFIFRFPQTKRKKAYDEIKNRLLNLQNPILFLRHLQKISWRIETLKAKVSEEMIYAKEKLSSRRYDDITMEKYHLVTPKETNSIFLFSRDVIVTDSEGEHSNHPIYIGFFYDEAKKRLITKRCNIHCFFPTKETFKTCFISHAPFLLTDNRQNIKQDENLNKDLLKLLADLAAESIVLLRDFGVKANNLLINENITKIVPSYQYYRYYWEGTNDPLFEKPIIDAFENLLKTEPLFLSRDNKYLLPTNAYTTPKSVFELLDTLQFQQLRKDNKSDFLNWELSQKILERKGSEDDHSKYPFFENIKRYEIEDFGKDITKDFMHSMTMPWVIKFYNFIREHASIHINITSQSRKSSLVFRSAPIIKTQRGEWVPPFINNTEPNVFLPIEGSKDNSNKYKIVSREYLADEYALKFFKQLEFKTPNELDYIRSIVLEKYKQEEVEIDNDIIRAEFLLLLNYFQKVHNTSEEEEYLQIVRDGILLVGDDGLLKCPKELYIETSILKQYFLHSKDAVFFDFNFYRRVLIGKYKQQFVYEFLECIGVNTKPTLDEVTNSYYSSYSIPTYIKEKFPAYRGNNYYDDVIIRDKELVGLKDACTNKSITKEVSVYLWNEILDELIDDTSEIRASISASTQRRSTYDHYTCECSFIRVLKAYPWIYNIDGEICKISDIFLEDLAPEYSLNSLIPNVLDIKKQNASLKDKYSVTDEEQQQYESGALVQALVKKGVPQDKITQTLQGLLDEVENEKYANRTEKNTKAKDNRTSSNVNEQNPDEVASETIADKLQKKWENQKNRSVGKPHSSTNNGDLFDYENKNDVTSPEDNAPFFTNNTGHNKSQSEEETNKAEKNLKAKNTKAQESAEDAKDQVEILELLKQTPKYTFKWYKILMELMHAGQSKVTNRRVQIDFSNYEIICSNKILHLTEPSLPVPAWITDAEKYSITILHENGSDKLDGLLVKSEDNALDISIEINNRMLSNLVKAKKIRVIAIDNTNIIDSLETRFLQLDKEDEFDMNANLPSNLSFIYGPPGTGKTTELVKQVHDILLEEPDAKILVLTPTNKAADVVAIKMTNDEVCEGGLARYGATESLYLIEEIGCVTHRDTTDVESFHNVVVATAARYAYDFIQPNDTPICDYDWDYIFIDEASMIDILTITYVVYKGASAKKIIISGDPMQIQPVVQNDMPALNIYDLVDLHGFSNAIFEYNRYPVKCLTMQHRSTPIIGKLVSDFAYDGLVECDPNRAPKKPLVLDGIPIKDVNFCGFEVALLDDIKGLNTIGQSAFNLYSVIFTYNMIEYTIKQIEKNHPEQDYTIGVVCAYRAQSDAIKNMLENRSLDTMYCKVSCGTVHSFQGDECDIMFIVLNPPATCTSGAHVNNQNIINVAMSRARDYIFFITPRGQVQGFTMKNRIGKLLNYNDISIQECRNIEKIMFYGNDNFIYENTHVTCHMPVNVYCENNTRYDVRMSDDALDIKINDIRT